MPSTDNGPAAWDSGEAGNVIADPRCAPDNTTTGNAPTGRSLQLREWKPITGAGALLGRAAAELLPIGLCISDIGVFRKDGRCWAQLPSEPQRDRDGQVVKDGRGKVQYRSALRWRDRELQDQFSRALIEAIERQHGPLGDGP
jgi:hypothetical protein